jgi:hypothetical protein
VRRDNAHSGIPVLCGPSYFRRVCSKFSVPYQDLVCL